MDTSRLGRGETIAAASAIALLFIMLVFDWFGVGGGSIDTGVGTITYHGAGGNAFQVFGFIDVILFITVVVAVVAAALSANATSVNTPVALSAITTGLGGLSVILIIYRIIDTPYGLDRKIGVWLGLIAAAGIAYGGWTAMQEEGTSFGDQRDRFGGGGRPRE